MSRQGGIAIALKALRERLQKALRGEIIENVLGLALLRGADLLVPLLILPHLVRTLGLVNFGNLNIALATSMYLGALVQYGFNITAVRDAATHKYDSAELGRILSSTLSAQLVLTLVGTSVLLGAVVLAQPLRQMASGICLAACYTVLRVLTPTWLLQGVGKMRIVALASVFVKAALVLSMYLLVTDESHTSVALALYAASALATFGIALYYVSRTLQVKLKLIHWRAPVSVIRQGRHAFLTQLAPTLYNSTTTLMLGLTAGPMAAGMLASAQKVVDTLASVANIVGGAFMPSLARDVRKRGVFVRIMWAMGVGMTIVCALASPIIAAALFGPEGHSVALTIAALSPSILALFVFSAYNTNFLMLAGYEREAKDIVVGVSTVLLIVSLLVVPKYGVAGAVGIVVGGRATLALLSIHSARVRGRLR